jgi:rSAM/selenodomain-associated transferase 2
MNGNFSPSRTEPGNAVTVTLIVPTLNEDANLRPCLSAVHAAGHDVEVIVVDGGSHDGTADIAHSFGAVVAKSPIAQRAAQMNLGAQRARGDVLVFLHADTILPPDWLGALRRGLHHRPDVVGGVFRRRFRGGSAFLRLTCWLADWRARQFGWFLGDQTIFARRAAFNAAGGFFPMTAFEDLEFSLRLGKQGRTVVLPVTAISSGRRFLAKGPLRQTLADLRLTVRFIRNRRAFDAGRRTPK